MLDELEELVDEVRLAFHVFGQFARDTNGERLDPPARAVLEYLSTHGETAVPEIARARGVSRQHIQTIVNGLEAQSLIHPVPNPAHKRSPLLVPTAEGAELMEAIAAEERRRLSSAFATFDRHRLISASKTLAEIRLLLDNLEANQ